MLSIKETKEAPITLRSFKKNKKIGISYIIFMLNIYSFPSFSNNLLFNQLKFILSINSVFTFKHESPRGGQLLKSLYPFILTYPHSDIAQSLTLTVLFLKTPERRSVPEIPSTYPHSDIAPEHYFNSPLPSLQRSRWLTTSDGGLSKGKWYLHVS